jgi:hypothetical protein
MVRDRHNTVREAFVNSKKPVVRGGSPPRSLIFSSRPANRLDAPQGNVPEHCTYVNGFFGHFCRKHATAGHI